MYSFHAQQFEFVNFLTGSEQFCSLFLFPDQQRTAKTSKEPQGPAQPLNAKTEHCIIVKILFNN